MGKIVGLTGRIGTGKTTVANLFKTLHGAFVINSDELGHKALLPSGGAYQAVVERFKFLPNLLDENGEINRKVLGYHVFLNNGELVALNEIVHPVVGRMIQELIDANTDKFILYECAILFETKYQFQFDAIIDTYCEQEVQIERAMKRDGVDRSQILLRLERQMSAEEMWCRSTHTVYTHPESDLTEQVNKIYAEITRS